MDPGHEDKRPRLSTTWPAGPSHHVSLPHPGPPLTTPTHHPQALPPPSSSQYSPSISSFHCRPQDYPQPHQQQQQQQQQQQPPPGPPPPPQHFDDRRQHEPDRYQPPQDHRHPPPPSPVHQSYSSQGYQQPPPPPRDSVVKREGDDVKLPQIGRPNSTGNGPEQSHLPPPPHPPPLLTAHGHSHPGHMEDRRLVSYESGHPPPPQMYRQSSYPAPQTPMSHTAPPTPYDQTQMYPPPPSMGPDYPISYASAAGKRKSQRASQACDSCRQLKAKCDENKPCKNCQEKNITCNYRDPAPKQQDKTTHDILDAVQKMLQTERQEILHEIVGLLKTELGDFKRGGRPHTPQGPQDAAASPGYMKDTGRRTMSPTQNPEQDEATSSSGGEGPANSIPDPEAANKWMRQMENEDDIEEPPGAPIRPQEAPFPHDHTTPQGRLLKWPSIRDLVGPLLHAEGIKYIDTYPLRWEENRGQLPLFGRGEGSTRATSDRDTCIDYAEIADDSSQVGDHQSPSAGTDWGQIGGLSPAGSGLPSDMRTANASRTDGTLEFEEAKVWKYVNLYKNHIQNMHLLIPPGDLDAMVVSFLDELGARKSKSQAKFASQTESPIQSGIDYERKRKRSPGPNGVEPGPLNKRHKPQRSTKHALVLLVLALGKICAWRDRKLPEAVEKEPPPYHGSPVVRNGLITSPNHGSPPASAISQSPGQAGLPSPKDHERSIASRRSSLQANMQAPTSAASPAPLQKKNYDVIPGLDYFAYATDILGNQLASYDLSNVQAHLLAGLYYGQLGRVIASFRHIRIACQLIVDKLQPSMERLQTKGVVDNARDNKYLVIFWSCCQLESDILAECNLIPSGILQYESSMPYPDMTILTSVSGFSEDVVHSYVAQLYLRKRMNEISGRLYNPKHLLLISEQLAETRAIEAILSKAKIWADKYHFNRDDPPAEDLLHARFRAKFWGANVITYRPYLENIMRQSHSRTRPEGSPIDPAVIECAKKGINALINSTEAFHNVKDRRFIITNVFGTAHAQWGNLITLAAAYRDPVLGPLVSEDKLRHLFRKTIEFFEVVAQDSSSLAIDLKVLRGLHESLPAKASIHQSYPAYIPPPMRPHSSAPYSAGPTPTPHSMHGPSPTPSDLSHSTPMDFS
ncbi:hypothetical protein BD289DRAFT_376004 [Coniella lustricola]|uniref:Zn(2)-C6 fungal-type domain-containing protein n=1 Tax=Coniella lustricola TaxID=2025994 RepID=A0A2T2ZXG5_9PEZI|nr:hypothetical protein BD289DRAFT_376004 [Coniella lustricola]